MIDPRPKPWDCIIAYNALGGYVVPASSSWRNCSQHILKGRVFESRMPQFVARHIGAGDIVHAALSLAISSPLFRAPVRRARASGPMSRSPRTTPAPRRRLR